MKTAKCKKVIGNGEVRTRTSEETGAENQRLGSLECMRRNIQKENERYAKNIYILNTKSQNTLNKNRITTIRISTLIQSNIAGYVIDTLDDLHAMFQLSQLICQFIAWEK